MILWKKFEEDCTEYLQQQFGKYATFTQQGKSNSRVSDILVCMSNGNKFYMIQKNIKNIK